MMAMKLKIVDGKWWIGAFSANLFFIGRLGRMREKVDGRRDGDG